MMRRLLLPMFLLCVSALVSYAAGPDGVADSLAVAPAAVADSLPQSPVRGKITPVDDDDERPPQPVLHYYDKHGERLPVPVLFVQETDTVRKPSPKSPYPLFSGINVGVNFADAIMLLAGQKHAGFDVAVDVSLHNWFFPTLEAGLGYAHDRPEGENFNYRCNLSPYLKLGLNYNFLYKSNPDYQIWLGLRAGWSSYRYTISDVTIPSGYWGGEDTVTLPEQRVTSWYGEALVGLRVKIAGPFSLGWSARYHFMLKRGKGSNSTPWYVPGYGASSPLAVTFSAWFSFGSGKPRPTLSGR